MERKNKKRRQKQKREDEVAKDDAESANSFLPEHTVLLLQQEREARERMIQDDDNEDVCYSIIQSQFQSQTTELKIEQTQNTFKFQKEKAVKQTQKQVGQYEYIKSMSRMFLRDKNKELVPLPLQSPPGTTHFSLCHNFPFKFCLVSLHPLLSSSLISFFLSYTCTYTYIVSKICRQIWHKLRQDFPSASKL